MELSLATFLQDSPRPFTATERELISQAFDFAQNAHEGQVRFSGEPYFSHVYETARYLLTRNLDAETIAAGFLHDVPEDTAITIEEIEKKFGGDIAFLVRGVTKLAQVRYQHTPESQTENLRKMLLATAEDIRVVLIKLADRYHNMQTLSAVPADKQYRIARETLEIYAPLAHRLGIGELKGQLEDLAFPYVLPKEHERLVKESGPHYNALTEYLARVMPHIRTELQKEGVFPLSINSRAKHLYSLYKKLLKEDKELDKIYDIAAVRIIVSDVAQCYRTLGAIHTLFKPLPGRIKDYIAMPKPNGYQSLHTTVFCLEGRIIEIQIRTQQMHEEAENGIAAHWAYSESGKPKKGALLAHNKLNWVTQLREWQNTPLGSDEFLESLKIDFFKNRIFVFTPTGDVIDLPEGATPIDFAYQIHSDIGDHCSGARVNQKMVSLNTILKNGDIVEIITQKNKMPNKSWLTLAKTSSARTKIRANLKKRGVFGFFNRS